jgi:hypothetical protein
MIEVLMVVGILVIIIGASYKLMVGGSKVYKAGVGGMDLNYEAQKAMINLGKDIRNSNYMDQPILADVNRIIKSTDSDINDFQKLRLISQEPDFTTIATGNKNLIHKDKIIEYSFEKNKDNNTYRLVKKYDGNSKGIKIAGKIKFGYFKREPREKITGTGSNMKIVNGMGPSVVQVYIELENPKIGKNSKTGYMVKYKTAFKIRGNQIN